MKKTANTASNSNASTGSTIATDRMEKASGFSAGLPSTEPASVPNWVWGIAFVAALLLALLVYSPALNGEFVFDDIALPFRSAPDYSTWDAARAMHGVRPLVGLSYWMAYNMGGSHPFAFHFASVSLHAASAVLLAYILFRLLTLGGWATRERGWLAFLGGGIFLLHPVQTEAVAYITSHSETMCAFFYFAAIAIFVSRREPPVSWRIALGTLVCFGLAMLSKEQALTLPIVLVLLDLAVYRQSPMDVLRNGWRLYGMVALGAVMGVAVVLNTLRDAQTAGFGMKDLQWWEYLLTQGRAILLYLRLYLLPVGQNGDYLFPISRSLFEHGGVVWWALIVAGLGAAWKYRRVAPMVALGYLLFLVVLSPTSSILPIQDAAVERRVYLSSLGLITATVGVLMLTKLSSSTLRYVGIGLLVVLSIFTFNRSKVWASGNAFWQDVIEKNPESWRANVAVGLKDLENKRCEAALQRFEVARPRVAANFEASWYMNYGAALDCVGRADEAEKAFLGSLKLEKNATVLSQLGVFYGRHERYQDSLRVLNEAIALTPNFPISYSNRGNVYARLGDCGRALPDFQRTLELMPGNTTAQRGIAYCREKLQGR